MALSYTELSATTQETFIPMLVDNVFNSNSLLQRMRKNSYKALSGGTRIVQPVLYATTTAGGWYSGTDTLSTTANDQITAAEYEWGYRYENITIEHTAELQNNGDAQVIEFVASKVQAAELTMADALGTGLYNLGTTTDAIVGLRLAVDSAGTYGSIARGTYTWWSAQEDSTTTVLTMNALQALYGDCTVGNDKPTVAMTTQDIYDDYVNLLTPQQRFTDDDTARGGFMNVMYNGIPMIVDSHVPASHLFMLNEKYLKLGYHPKDNFRFSPFVQPVDQAVASAKIFWAGQLLCSNCRMQGKMNAIA